MQNIRGGVGCRGLSLKLRPPWLQRVAAGRCGTGCMLIEQTAVRACHKMGKCGRGARALGSERLDRVVSARVGKGHSQSNIPNGLSWRACTGHGSEPWRWSSLIRRKARRRTPVDKSFPITLSMEPANGLAFGGARGSDTQRCRHPPSHPPCHASPALAAQQAPAHRA